MSRYIIIGQLVGVHGVRGEVKIAPLTDDVRRFASLKDAFLLDADEKLVRDVYLQSSRQADTLMICKFKSLDDRDDAKQLSGHFLAVLREDAVSLEAGRFFIADLIGMEVVDSQRGFIGHIKDIIQQGVGADVIVVKRRGKMELLFPYLNAIVSHVDVDNKRMNADIPDDLYAIYENKASQEQES